MRRGMSTLPITYGPVVIGYSVTISENFFPSPHLRLKIGSVPATNSWSRVRCRRWKRTVLESTISARSMPARTVWYGGDASFEFSVSKLCFTSAGVTGSPFEKRACGRMRNATDEKSGATNIDSASSAYIVDGSSADRCARPSSIQIATPAGALPRVVNGLNLSKLVRRSGLRSRSVLPRGASGLTYSKCVNPSGYLGSPNAAKPCTQRPVAAAPAAAGAAAAGGRPAAIAECSAPANGEPEMATARRRRNGSTRSNGDELTRDAGSTAD